jgi:hypothetical protein
MRKFSSEKAYKLVKSVVIAITVLSIFAVLLGNNNVNQYENLFQKNSETCIQMYPHVNGATGQEWQRNQDMVDACYEIFPKVDLKLRDNAQNLMNGGLIIAIFLPLIFFGGRLAYKYVFPKTKKE